jgi:hypothetical protein
MKDPLLNIVRLKSLEEILARARDLIRRHRRRFLKRNLRPCPNNCKLADLQGHRVVGCSTCGSHNPDQCLVTGKFVPIFTKEDLAKQFADQLRDPQVLLRDYRDITVFLWVLGGFDEKVDETLVSGMEQHHEVDQKHTVVDDDNRGNHIRNSDSDSSQRYGAAASGTSGSVDDDNRGNK